MVTLQQYDLVVWDWNGTLLDDLWLCLEIANGMLTRRGLPTMDAWRYREIFDFPVSEYYRRAGFDFEREPFPVLAEEFIGEYNNRVGECALHPEALPFLTYLDSRGIRNAVLSASRHDSLTTAMESFGILPLFEEVRGITDHFAVSKTDAGKDLLSRLAVPANRTVLIGDTTHDYEVAREMGIAIILIADGHQSWEKLLSTGVPVYPSLGELWSGMKVPT